MINSNFLIDFGLFFTYGSCFLILLSKIPYRLKSKKIEYVDIVCNPWEFVYGYNLDTFKPLFLDMQKLPHVLVAGMTGSGKSTCLNAIIKNLLYNKNCLLHLVDFKRVELSIFSSSSQVRNFITDKDDFKDFLFKLFNRVNMRYESFNYYNCRNIVEYNLKCDKKMSYEYVIIDEFAMLKNDKQIMLLLEQLLSISRGCGIYFIIATQRPDSKILDGGIKCNIGNILGFKVMDSVNSRIVCDFSGLEDLKGQGFGISFIGGVKQNFRGYFVTDEQIMEVLK